MLRRKTDSGDRLVYVSEGIKSCDDFKFNQIFYTFSSILISQRTFSKTTAREIDKRSIRLKIAIKVNWMQWIKIKRHIIINNFKIRFCFPLLWMSFQLYYNSSFRVVIGFEDKKFDMWILNVVRRFIECSSPQWVYIRRRET